MTKTRFFVAILVASLLVLTGQATAKDRLQQTINVPAQFAATIDTTDCSMAPGPRVTLSGNLRLSPVDIELIFSHMMGATDPKSNVTVRKSVVPPDAQPTASPQQSIIAAFSANPYLWLQITDAKGQPLTSEVFLGRCDQGHFTPTIDFSLSAKATGDVAANSCDASPGPIVQLNGQMEATPVHGKVIFRSSNEAGVGGSKPSEVAIDVVFTASGPAFLLPQEDAQAGTGGNPLISTQYRLGNGTAVGNEEQLGRCAVLVN